MVFFAFCTNDHTLNFIKYMLSQEIEALGEVRTKNSGSTLFSMFFSMVEFLSVIESISQVKYFVTKLQRLK